MKTRGKSLDALRQELRTVWEPREVCNDWLVRFEARKQADKLRAIIKRRERRA
jgi:hypothetical protein